MQYTFGTSVNKFLKTSEIHLSSHLETSGEKDTQILFVFQSKFAIYRT